MRSTRACAAGVIALAVAASPVMNARADGPSASQAQGAPSAPPAAARASGVAVVARSGADAGAAWALAQEIYAQPSLRPASLDEARARVLVGEAPAADAPRGTRDLADERTAVHGDDGASRALLASIASQVGASALLVVELGPSNAPVARLFFAETQSYDAARYEPDAVASPASVDAGTAAATTLPVAASDGGTMDASTDAQPPTAAAATSSQPPTGYRWSATAASVERVLSAPAVLHAPALATSPTPPAKTKEPESHPFYTSPWFWGAVGAAAFGGTAVWFATRDNSPSTIHLDLQVPK